VLDALVIRRLVMPATLLLIGPRVWGRRRTAAVAEPAVPAIPVETQEEFRGIPDANLR